METEKSWLGGCADRIEHIGRRRGRSEAAVSIIGLGLVEPGAGHPLQVRGSLLGLTPMAVELDLPRTSSMRCSCAIGGTRGDRLRQLDSGVMRRVDVE